MENDAKPTEEKPVEQKPTEEKPVEQKPTEQKPAEEKPVVAAIDPEEYARLKKERDDLAAEKQKAEDAQKTEAEREKSRADRAEEATKAQEATIRRLAIRQAVIDAGPGQKVTIDPTALDTLYRAGEFDSIKVKDGVPDGIEGHLKTVLAKYPFLAKAPAKAPEIHAGKGGAADVDEAGNISDDRKARLAKRFKI